MAELPEDTRLVYVNWARMQATPFDLAIDVGYHDEPGPPDSYPVRLVMTWEHARALAELIESNVHAYEEQAGEIRDLVDRTEAGDDD